MNHARTERGFSNFFMNETSSWLYLVLIAQLPYMTCAALIPFIRSMMCVFVWWMNESFTKLGSEREISSHAANHQLHIITEPVSKTRQFHMILYNYAAFINYTRGLDNSNPTTFFSPFCSSFSFSILFTFLPAPILSIYLVLFTTFREKTKTLLGSGFKKIKSEGENCMKRQWIEAKQKNMNEIVLSSNLEKISLLQLSTSCCRLLCGESEWERTNDIRQRIQRRCKHVLWMMRHSDMVLWNV